MSPVEQERFARANRKLAEEKIRDEIRNAVRAELAKEGLSRSIVEKAARETIKDLVRERVEIVLNGSAVREHLDRFIEERIKEAFGSVDVKKALKDQLIEQARQSAAKFVEERVLIDVRGQEFGSF